MAQRRFRMALQRMVLGIGFLGVMVDQVSWSPTTISAQTTETQESGGGKSEPSEPELREQLLARVEVDQAARLQWIEQMKRQSQDSPDDASESAPREVPNSDESTEGVEDNDASEIARSSETTTTAENSETSVVIDLDQVPKIELGLIEIDRRNQLWLEQLVDLTGWPIKDRVGIDGAHAAWLLVQHSDGDPAFQRQCLDLMKQAEVGQVAAVDIAYLEDRVRVAEGVPQRFGTQAALVGGEWLIKDLEDPEHVDERRAELGLPPLNEYLEVIRKMYQVPQDQPQPKARASDQRGCEQGK